MLYIKIYILIQYDSIPSQRSTKFFCPGVILLNSEGSAAHKCKNLNLKLVGTFLIFAAGQIKDLGGPYFGDPCAQ